MAEADRAAGAAVRGSRVARVLCLVVGVVYTVVGVWGLVEGGPDAMGNIPATDAGPTVGGFGGSPFLNLAHLTIGVLAFLAAAFPRGPFIFGVVSLVALAAFIAYDIVALVVDIPGEPLSVHPPALVMHVCTWLAAVGMVVAEYRSGAATMEGTVLD